jgi:hypothetical protein
MTSTKAINCPDCGAQVRLYIKDFARGKYEFECPHCHGAEVESIYGALAVPGDGIPDGATVGKKIEAGAGN